MTESTYTLTVPATTVPNGGTMSVRAGSALATPGTGERAPSLMPASIPSDQVYYWSALWQDSIREAMTALDAGEYEEFNSDDPADVVRWLFSDDEE
jgi:hypothetical protein